VCVCECLPLFACLFVFFRVFACVYMFLRVFACVCVCLFMPVFCVFAACGCVCLRVFAGVCVCWRGFACVDFPYLVGTCVGSDAALWGHEDLMGTWSMSP